MASQTGQNASEDAKTVSHWTTAKSLLPYLWVKGRWDLRWRVILALSFLVAAKFIGVYVPFLFKDTVDALSPKATAEAIAIAIPTGLIIGYGIARVLSLLFGELRDAVFVKVGQHALRQVALKTFRHLHNLSLSFHLERKTGGLSRIIERGTKGIDFLLRFMLFNILPTLLEIVLISSIFWVKFGFLYAAVTFAALASYIYFTIAVTEWRLKFRREMNDQDTKANTKAIDSLINFETVKYFTNEEHESRRYDKALERFESAAVRSQFSLTLLNVGQGLIISLGLVFVLWMGAQGVVQGKFTIGEYVLINSLLIQIYMPLNFLGFVYREIKQSLTDMEKMFEVISTHSDVTDNVDAKDLEINGGGVLFRDVKFHYAENRPILKGINFMVPAGTTTAIVGASGAGKSTISRILFRFYDIAEGGVSVDGQDIRTITQKSLREQIGVVPQDTVLFNDTILYNIRYGRPGATDEEVIEAARLAQIHNFIEALPEGYDTEVGERGLKLSGGEKQRVAIARTILKNPAILLLDEATSALDSQTERDIQASLEQISKDRTTIVIAHRLSTIVDSDEILVMDAGEIVERGTHSELLDMQGMYADMWQRQLEVKEAKEKLVKLEA
ncbi:ABC transporter ATP-binding protein/permease [Kordiimonas sp. SCSIO 12603]|uniref:ABCB family ABC transporter ATP-binding protein/permease n=1 Tax=Kordiimonas sp. SCSIO 12603 TaxID=2829596 RepID=UPI002104DBDE|nr:ABC transporter ATP-binding protein/permease [Kordiimonas sp. SCSIO 12603]UTW58288.1 ABC transporter ATP-binding protein/permease [Kordiimonas sp. SCSIO 12603]